MRSRIGRPGPAMVVACTALIVAVGGTSYAAVEMIGSRNIENDSIKSVDVRDDRLKGLDIKESSLEQVNTAKLADNATSADVATALAPAAAAETKVRWALIDKNGAIEAQSGGFTILDAYVTNTNVYIDAGESLVDKSVTASLATSNLVDINGDAMVDAADRALGSNGQVTASRCQIPMVVECAPANAKNLNALVVTPRLADGTGTTATSRKRFYVTVSE